MLAFLDLATDENAFNKRYGATFPLYKFHRLYEDRDYQPIWRIRSRMSTL